MGKEGRKEEKRKLPHAHTHTMALMPLNSCKARESGDDSGGRCRGRQWRGWAVMALRALFFVALLILADAQKWPVSGDCRPCVCSYERTSFGRMRTVNCSRRGLRAIPAGLPNDLMALDLSWNSLDVDQLRQHLCRFQSLQAVSLSFADLTTLSDILKECSSVLELNLTGNRLTQIDSQTFMGLKNVRRLLGLEVESVVDRNVFKDLTNLKDLDVLFHGATLPKGLFDDLGIQSLNLVVTQATSLPKRVFQFGHKTLNTLQLIGESITQVDEDLLDGLVVLKKLYLVMPSVKQLPERFFHSQQLQLGDGRTKLANLQEVEISGVHGLPALLFNKLVTLETLQLKEIGSFPQLGFLAGAVNLRTLLVTGSKLTSIPAGWFQQLYSLETLTLSGLELKRLDESAFQGLLNLNYLDLSNNNLERVSAKLLAPLNKALETLILRGNFLKEINKDVLGELGALRHLDVGENRLTTVYANSFVGMTYLSSLYLNNNRLTSLPRSLFRNVLHLESLSLSDNYLVEFPQAVLQLGGSLISLDLASNELTKVPALQLCRFTYLETVSVMGNYLHCDCSVLAFQQCQLISVDGQCNTPKEYQNMAISDVKVPIFCLEEYKAKQLMDQQANALTLVSTPSAVIGTTPQPAQNYQPSKKTSSGKPSGAEDPPANGQQEKVSNQNALSTSTSKTYSAESGAQLTKTSTIVKNLFTEKLANQSKTKTSVLPLGPEQNVKENTVTVVEKTTSSLQKKQELGLPSAKIDKVAPESNIKVTVNGEKMQDVSSDQGSTSTHTKQSKDAIPNSLDVKNEYPQSKAGTPQANIKTDVESTAPDKRITNSNSARPFSESNNAELSVNPQTRTNVGGKAVVNPEQEGVSENGKDSPQPVSNNLSRNVAPSSLSPNQETNVISLSTQSPSPVQEEQSSNVTSSADDGIQISNVSYEELPDEGTGDDKQKSPYSEKMAFNFIISALVTLSLSGLVVLGVVFIRRWHQKGSYVISEDTELNNVNSDDIMEAEAKAKAELA